MHSRCSTTSSPACGSTTNRPGCAPFRCILTVTVDERAQNLVCSLHIHIAQFSQRALGFIRVDITVIEIGINPLGEHLNIKFRVELGGINVATHPKHLHRTSVRCS